MTIALAAIAGHLVLDAAGIADAGIGPKAIESFNLEKPASTMDHSTARLDMPKVAMPENLLRGRQFGRVNLFSVAELSDEDLRNPFQIRVQIAVDMKETKFEIGGIVESSADNKNTVLLVYRPPTTNKATGNAEHENSTEQNAEAKGEKDPNAAAKEKEKAKPEIRVCGVGDEIDGFKIYAILRDSIIIEQSGRYVEIGRGGPVTVCVPLSQTQ